ncbi:unnamed protein product [Soboliphyme baturini]|uniref:Uncharacterized protein n=1 Tax=Soboliphyme baturini TaxID=241478 RepID=A0A183IS40_9BILA|nr:unnamed protein product [Soboliphyme baturini]
MHSYVSIRRTGIGASDSDGGISLRRDADGHTGDSVPLSVPLPPAFASGAHLSIVGPLPLPSLSPPPPPPPPPPLCVHKYARSVAAEFFAHARSCNFP